MLANSGPVQGEQERARLQGRMDEATPLPAICRASDSWLEVLGVALYPSVKAQSMNSTLTAEDLWPLLLKLPHDEQVRLAKLALRAAARSGRAEAEAYRTHPPGKDEFSSEEEPLAWEAEGWEQFDASR
jgi:hypothetical protein